MQVKYLQNLKIILLNTCYSMKKGANKINYGSTVIPKVRGIRKSLFRVSTVKETKDTGVCLPRVG